MRKLFFAGDTQQVLPWWCTDTDNLLGFANNIRTVDGGTLKD